jgi:hypothetical protein
MKKNVKMIVNENMYDKLMKKRFIGMCDKLRMDCEQNEEHWHEMMANKREIPTEFFIDSVDMTPILDEDETPEEFIEYNKMSDDTSAAYVSNWGDKEAMFFQTAGFEYIFV